VERCTCWSTRPAIFADRRLYDEEVRAVPVFRKDGRSVLFIHVPKAGGSSIERMFGDAGYTVHYRDPRLGKGSLNRLRRCSPQHMHASILQEVFRIDLFDVVFMVTRHPLTRFRSEYGYARRHEDVATDSEAVEQWAEKAFSAYAKDPFHLDNHLRPQSDFYLPGCTVYRLEDGMERVMTDLGRRLGTDFGGEVPRVLERKKESGVSSSEFTVSGQLQRRVEAFYSEDYDRFGYQRGA
jgi:hypothetical protein